MAKCRCSCGTTKEILTSSLKAGRTASCGCSKDRYTKTTGDRNVSFRGYKEIRSHFWNGYKRGAADRGLEFSLTLVYAWNLFEAQGRVCALSGEPLVFGTNHTHGSTTASLDRLNNEEGYVPGNVQWVHKKVNVMRHTLTVPAFVEWCKKVVEHADRLSTR